MENEEEEKKLEKEEETKVKVKEEDTSKEEIESLKQELADKTKEVSTLSEQKKHFRTKLQELQDGDGTGNKKKIEPELDTTPKDDDISTVDLYSLIESKVSQEDVKEVTKYAKLLNLSIGDALKDATVIAILKDRQGKRDTANATSTETSKAGAKTTTDNELLKNLSEGKVPERGSKEAEDLFWAKRGGKR